MKTALAYLGHQVQLQPVGAGIVVRLGILCFMAFGLAWSPAQLAAVMAFVEALIGFLTYTGVTPNVSVQTTVQTALQSTGMDEATAKAVSQGKGQGT